MTEEVKKEEVNPEEMTEMPEAAEAEPESEAEAPEQEAEAEAAPEEEKSSRKGLFGRSDKALKESEKKLKKSSTKPTTASSASSRSLTISASAARRKKPRSLRSAPAACWKNCFRSWTVLKEGSAA